jgi:branched-chain amino acid transport system substrate-binding protein
MRGWGAVVIAVVVVASACGQGREPAIVVGAVYPLSGSQGPGGVDEHRGVLLAAELANHDGGIAGRPVEIRSVDVPGSDAVPAAIRSLDDRGVRFVLGSYGSTLSRPAADESARRGMLFWETGAVGEMSGTAGGELVFRAAPSGGVLGRAAVAFVADQLAPKLGREPPTLRFAVAGVDDVYGRSVMAGAVDEIGNRSLPFAGRFTYGLPGADYPGIAERVAGSDADVLFVAAYLEDGIELRHEVVRQDLPLVVSIGTSSSYCMPEFGAALGPDAVGVFASDKPDGDALDPAGLTPGAADLLARARSAYRERYREEMSAPALAGFSAAWALFTAVMPSARELTPESVGRAALTVDIPMGGLPSGSGLRFAPPGGPDSGANLRAASVIWEWIRPNVRAVVWPPAFATTDVAIPPGSGS